ncbi:DUF1194 domain-containing protein [Alphaproteobacteria bacterium GH1-50]|uniref:DUF1194 domain-containing protein n=1 Tax=Kangsaoukella pontilimi TaxID=2691042 RepID=A0A7C9ISP3_9RHOB|nr:DUF1194 domain-containing protein [Kangsaoukella pontilimi]MXQ08786.1 DUF1194 domain-containing protein [Kangsaoukella pontilimi]
MRRLAAIALVALWPGFADAACRLALLLALDVSGSVDAREYALQIEGVASALDDNEVRRVLLAMPEAPVALSIFEWSSASYQKVVQDWVLLTDSESLNRVIAALRNWQRMPAPEATGLGAALEFSYRHFQNAPACWDQTLDVSADGKNNDWPIPERLRRGGELGSMKVNALVVAPDFLVTYDTSGSGIQGLRDYFENNIIYGPGAFTEVAMGFDDYARAMHLKLLRELATLPLGALPRPAPFRTVLNRTTTPRPQ